MSALIHNKKAGLNYEILERFEAGIELLGLEVKSLKQNQGSLDNAYVTVRGAEAFIMNMFIPPFQPLNTKGYDPIRLRKLLLTKAEIQRLATIEKGLTIVPITMYNKGRNIKVEIAAVKGRKKYDKREVIKKRDIDREIRREYTDR